MNAQSNRFTIRIIATLFTLTALLAIISGASAQGEAPLPLPQDSGAHLRPLFTDHQQSRHAVPPLYQGTVRSRTVGVDPSAMNITSAEISARTASSPLTLNLFDNLTVTAVNTSLETRLNAAGYIWSGRLAEDPFSSVVLVFDGQQMAGEVSSSSGSYLIRPGMSGEHHIIEIAPELMVEASGNDAIPMPDDPPAWMTSATSNTAYSQPAGNQPIELPGRNSLTTIDLMVVYTPKSVAQIGGENAMRGVIESLVAFANQAYAQSGVQHRLRLVHAEKVSYSEQGIVEDLYALSDMSDSYLNEVHTLRDLYQADVVTMISSNQSCGVGYLMTSMKSHSPAFAFNIVDVSCSAGRTLAHEVGHNLGAQHDIDNTEMPGVTPYAYGYQDPGGTFATIMAYGIKGTCARSCPRIPYFSNPHLRYNGRPLGSAHADNARVFAETAPFVATHRTGTPAGFRLVAPSNQSLLPSREASFVWQPQAGADRYTLKINSEDGKYKYKVKLDPAQVCSANQCSYSPAADSKWKPRANTSHRWFVKARVSGVALTSSEKWTFNNNLLPQTIHVISPVSEQTLNTSSVAFHWQADARLTHYVLKIKDNSGVRISKQKFTAGQICPAGTSACSVDLRLDAGVANGNYTWQIVGKRDGVKGKAKAKSVVRIHR